MYHVAHRGAPAAPWRAVKRHDAPWRAVDECRIRRDEETIYIAYISYRKLRWKIHEFFARLNSSDRSLGDEFFKIIKLKSRKRNKQDNIYVISLCFTSDDRFFFFLEN